MKGKLPALTSNLNFTGRYLVLTTGDKKFGLSSKLAQEDRHRLSGWLKEEAERPDKEFWYHCPDQCRRRFQRRDPEGTGMAEEPLP